MCDSAEVNQAAHKESTLKAGAKGRPVVIPLHPQLAAHLEGIATADHAQKC